MAHLEQRILIRTDLNLVPGLVTAQVAHLHAECMRNHILHGEDGNPTNEVQISYTGLKDWLAEPYVFVHGVSNPELLDLYIEKAKDTVPVYKWSDTVYIEPSAGNKMVLDNVLIGAAFGPDSSDDIKSLGIAQLDLLWQRIPEITG